MATWDKPPPAIVRDRLAPADRAYYQARANPAVYRPSPAAQRATQAAANRAAAARQAAAQRPRGTAAPNARFVAPGHARFVPPPPPPPKPRPWREVEQERINLAAHSRRTGGPLSPFDILDALGQFSNEVAFGVAHKSPKGPFAATDAGSANMALARDKGKQDDEKVRQAGALFQVQSKSNDPDSGGYKKFTAKEYKDFRAKHPGEDLQMPDISAADGGGVYVYLAGNTSLTGDMTTTSQAAVWAHLSPQEKYEYLNIRLALRNTKRTAGIVQPAVSTRGLGGVEITGEGTRWDLALRANSIAVSGQRRWLMDQFEADHTGKKIRGGFFSGSQLGFTGSNTPWDFVPNFLVYQEVLPDGSLGMKSIMSLEDVYDAIKSDAMHDQYAAGELTVAMANGNYIPGAQTKFISDYVGFDANGRPIAQWNHDYDNSLRNMVQAIAESQAAEDVPGSPAKSFWEELRGQAQHNQDTIAQAEGGPPLDGGGGGGHGWSNWGGGGYGGYGYGGGGGGGGQRVFLTDPTELGAQLDSIARARLGRVMTAEEKAAFVDYFHGLETQYSAAYNAGGVATQPSAEGQAVAWIESRYGAEQTSETAGEFISALAAFIRGPGLGSGGSGS